MGTLRPAHAVGTRSAITLETGLGRSHLRNFLLVEI